MIIRVTLVLLLIILLCVAPARAYSVLSHEVVVDLLWTDGIEPLLRLKFPDATEDDLRKAHAFAYGGSIIQDIGYYPFGSKEFTNLTHYVRSGDFVMALLSEAQNLNEYAFALGALAHYASDIEGHPFINQSVGDEFPQLRRHFGSTVTFEDDPKAHIRVEFGFDVAQVAKKRFPSDAYHNFIGFQVSKPLLERAFRDTYGLELNEVMKHEDLAIGTYRRSVSKIIPAFTRAALATHKAELVREAPNFNRKKFLYHISRAQYTREWGANYQRPGFGARLLAVFVKLLPKVGPFKAADFKIPNAHTEDLYFKSMDKTIDFYHLELNDLKAGKLVLANMDFDTGQVTRPGEYELCDDAFAQLLDQLAAKHFQTVSSDLRENLLDYYFIPSGVVVCTGKQREKTQREIEQLKETTSVADGSSASQD